MVIASKSCEFLFLYCLVFFTSYELAAIFMNNIVLSSVALLALCGVERLGCSFLLGVNQLQMVVEV